MVSSVEVKIAILDPCVGLFHCLRIPWMLLLTATQAQIHFSCSRLFRFLAVDWWYETSRFFQEIWFQRNFYHCVHLNWTPNTRFSMLCGNFIKYVSSQAKNYGEIKGNEIIRITLTRAVTFNIAQSWRRKKMLSYCLCKHVRARISFCLHCLICRFRWLKKWQHNNYSS